MRLSYGPYEREGSNVSIKKVRLQFLWNVKARVPDVTADLFEACYPLYQKLLVSSPSSVQRGWQETKSSSEATELLNFLVQWSVRHNLDADWCRQWAMTAMKAWSSDEEALQTLSWCKFPEVVRHVLFPQFYSHINFDSERLRTVRWVIEQLGIVDFGPDAEPTGPVPDPPKGLPRWWFTATCRDEYLRDVELTLRERIEEGELLAAAGSSLKEAYIREVSNVASNYCDSVEKFLAREGGWKKAKVFRDHRAHLTHIVWAVMFQIEGKSYSEIAAEMQSELDNEPFVSTVKRGVAEILDTIGLAVDKRLQVKPGPKPGRNLSSKEKVTKEILKSLGS